jgi:hypothetical protein
MTTTGARQGRLFPIASGPEPSGRLEVFASSIQTGFKWQGHEIEPWTILSRTDAASHCRLCGAEIWATSRKTVPAWSDVPGICPNAVGVPPMIRNQANRQQP